MMDLSRLALSVSLVAPVIASACADANLAEIPSKADARAALGKADFADELCELLGEPPECDLCDAAGWYGDGVCDEFCREPDPDCLPAGASYRLQSRLSVPKGIPEGAIVGLTAFSDMVDGEHDPATWVLDRVEASLTGSKLLAIRLARELGLDEALNDSLTANLPNLIPSLLDLGENVDQVVTTFGMRSRLSIAGNPADGTESAIHSFVSPVFWVDGQRYDFSAADHPFTGIAQAEAISVIRPDPDVIAIGRHTLGIPYGDILRFAIDNAVVPAHDPSADSLGDVAVSLIDCELVGVFVEAELGIPFDRPWMYESACTRGVKLGIRFIESSFDGVSADLVLEGRADLGDGVIRVGEWSGDLEFEAGATAVDGPFIAAECLGEPEACGS